MSNVTDLGGEVRRHEAVTLAVEAAREALALNEIVTSEVREAVARIVRAMDTPH